MQGVGLLYKFFAGHRGYEFSFLLSRKKQIVGYGSGQKSLQGGLHNLFSLPDDKKAQRNKVIGNQRPQFFYPLQPV